MSLTTTEPAKTFRVGIVASRALDDPDFLHELIIPHLAAISHLYTNGANPLVSALAAAHGLPLTTFPLTGGRCLPWSTGMILDNVDFVYIIADPSSKSAGQVIEACESRKVKHRLISYTPYSHWAEKVGKVSAVLAALSPDELAASDALKAIRRVV